MSIRFARLATAALVTAATVLAHYTWIWPAAGPLTVGKTQTIHIGHGHEFPQSEEAIAASQISLFAIPPSGVRVTLEPKPGSGVVTAAYEVKETGLHRIALTQDRGITSRTPRGVKTGGRDKNPDAMRSTRTFRSAVAYARTPNAPVAGAAPVGVEFELAGDYAGGGWRIQVLKHGKPAAGADVQVLLGGTSARTLGKTAADGRVSYTAPAGAKGPALFFVALTEPAPAGAAHDAVNYEASLAVSW